MSRPVEHGTAQAQALAGETMTRKPDELLIDRFQRGEEDAFHEIVVRYKTELVSYLTRTVGDNGWAEDLAQDVFLKVFLNAGNFKARSRFSTWLYRIAHNRAVDFLKRKKHEPLLVLNAPRDSEQTDMPLGVLDRSQGPEQASLRNELEEKIMEIIDQMEEKYRTVFVLCAMQRLSYEEASEVTGLPVKTVSSRLCRARKFFRARAQPLLDVPV